LIARGTLIHRGRTIAVVRCDITGPDGALVAEATGSVLILPGRHWERPVSEPVRRPLRSWCVKRLVRGAQLVVVAARAVEDTLRGRCVLATEPREDRLGARQLRAGDMLGHLQVGLPCLP
jgi:hypothetical protein